MANILLLNPTYIGSLHQKNFPHGLLAVAAALIKNGHNVQIIDSHIKQYDPIQALQAIASLNFDIVGISGISTAYYFWREFVPLFRQKYGNGIPMVAGGSVAATMPEVFLKYTDVDAICTGDAEPVINELVDCLLHKKSLGKLEGIGYRNGNDFIIKPGIRVKNMDAEVSIPSYDLIDVDLYRKNDSRRTKEFVIFSSRGCPFNCYFCSQNFGKYFIQHSVNNFIEHVAFIAKKYSPDLFCFSDELFTANRKWVIEFLTKYKESGIGLPFRINARVNTIDKELLTILKDANCCEIALGIESGSSTILREMRKNITSEQNVRALKMAREVGLFASVTLVLGMPSETDETIEETKSMLIEADVKTFGGFFATAYPASPLFEYAISKGLISDVDDYMVKVGNATKLLINFTKLDDKYLQKKLKELGRDVEYAWYKKRGIYYLLKFKLRPLKNAFDILREKGLIALVSKIVGKIKN